MNKPSKIVDRDARIMFRNFSGKESQFNPAGARNFCLILDPEIAPQLEAEGWNVKQTKPREEGDVPEFYIQVKVKYGMYPPSIYTVTSRGKTLLDEADVAQLDRLRFKKIALTVNPSVWSTPTGEGISAYVEEMYVTLVESVLDDEYGDIPDNTNR